MHNLWLWLGLLAVLSGAAALIYGKGHMHRQYQRAVRDALASVQCAKTQRLTPAMIAHLPAAVQRYMAYTKVIGKPQVAYVQVAASGKMKLNPKAKWADIHVEQTNVLGKDLQRLFLIDLKILCFHMYGLHLYTQHTARMTGRLLGLIKVLDASGKEMRIGDTVTLLNDICLFAPAALADERFSYTEIDTDTVKVTFRTAYCTVSAMLYFDESGQLLRFVSDDRYYIENKKPPRQVRWATPIHTYQTMHGYRLMNRGEAVWHFADTTFPYIQFTQISEVLYNQPPAGC